MKVHRMNIGIGLGTGDAHVRFGLIRFGSRVDVYLPEGVHPLVGVGKEGLTASPDEIASYLRAGAAATWAESARTSS